MSSWCHQSGPPTSPASSPTTRAYAPRTLNSLPAPPGIPGFPTYVEWLFLPCPAPPHSHGNPSHPSRPSSNVISSVKALLISPTGCAIFLFSVSSDSTFFVHQGTFLTLQPFVSFLLGPCYLSLSS